jgi:DNA-binding response OmpR family regulator
MAKILFVDDDVDHVKMASAVLARENHVIDPAYTGADAKHLISISGYDIIILDWQLPDTTGIEFLKWYRGIGSAPVIMLTGKGTISDREEGLDSGADDYMIKPFSTRELAARIRAILRRPGKTAATDLMAGAYKLDPSNLTVSKDGSEVRLPPREFALLEFLARNPDEIFKGDVLMSRVWSAESEATTDSLRTAVKQIRKKLNNDGIIETIPGAGYKLGK